MHTDVGERFEVFDETGNPLGLAPRSACHGNPRLVHRTAHVVVTHPDGRLLLQKRAATKDIQPGKWDTAVESENITVFSAVSAGPCRPPPDEIDEVRFWSAVELDAALGTGAFTPNLESELAELKKRTALRN